MTRLSSTTTKLKKTKKPKVSIMLNGKPILRISEARRKFGISRLPSSTTRIDDDGKEAARTTKPPTTQNDVAATVQQQQDNISEEGLKSLVHGAKLTSKQEIRLMKHYEGKQSELILHLKRLCSVRQVEELIDQLNEKKKLEQKQEQQEEEREEEVVAATDDTAATTKEDDVKDVDDHQSVQNSMVDNKSVQSIKSIKSVKSVGTAGSSNSNSSNKSITSLRGGTKKASSTSPSTNTTTQLKQANYSAVDTSYDDDAQWKNDLSPSSFTEADVLQTRQQQSSVIKTLSSSVENSDTTKSVQNDFSSILPNNGVMSMKDGTTKDDTEGKGEEEEDINMEPNIETIDNNGEVYIAFYQPPDQDDKDTIGGFDLNGTVHNLQLMVDGAMTETLTLGTQAMEQLKASFPTDMGNVEQMNQFTQELMSRFTNAGKEDEEKEAVEEEEKEQVIVMDTPKNADNGSKGEDTPKEENDPTQEEEENVVVDTPKDANNASGTDIIEDVPPSSYRCDPGTVQEEEPAQQEEKESWFEQLMSMNFCTIPTSHEETTNVDKDLKTQADVQDKLMTLMTRANIGSKADKLMEKYRGMEDKLIAHLERFRAEEAADGNEDDRNDAENPVVVIQNEEVRC